MSRSLGTLTLDLVARLGGYEQGLDKAEKEAKKRAAAIERVFEQATATVAAAFASLAAAGTAALTAINAQADTIAGFQDLSDKIGDTAEQIATLQIASSLSGVAIDTVAAASIKLTSALSKTDDESKAVGQALKDIGINFDEFKKLSPVAQIDAVANALAEFEDGAGKTAIAVSLFGKSGAEILPFLKDLAEGGQRQVKLTAEQIAAADEYTKATARLRAEFESFVQQQTANYIPTLSEVQSVLAEVAKNQDVVTVAVGGLEVAVKAALVVLQTLLVVGSDVVYVFKMTGVEIGAMAAQLAALARLDFNGFKAISEAVKGDAERARKELDAFQARVMKIGQPDPNTGLGFGTRSAEDRRWSPVPLRTLAPTALKTGGTTDDPAKKLLENQLKELERTINSEKELMAERNKFLDLYNSQGLLSIEDYYKTQDVIRDESMRKQEAALASQLEILKKARAGADKETDRAELQGKINEVLEKQEKLQRSNSAAAVEAQIKQSIAWKEQEATILAARQAAQDFYDTAMRGYERQLSGVGMGSKFRELQSQIQGIEEKYQQQRQDLANQRAQAELGGPLSEQAKRDYERRLEIINEFEAKTVSAAKTTFAALDEAQSNWLNGATEALANYADEAKNIAKQVEDALTNAFSGLEDTLVEFLTTGKADFKAFADSIIKDMVRIIVRTQITGPLAEWSKGLFKGGGDGEGFDWSKAAGFISGLFGGGKASGGPVAPNTMYRVNENGPELFQAANGDQFLMTGTQSGNIVPNNALGGGGGMGDWTIINHSGVPFSKETMSVSPRERALIIRDARRSVAAEWADPNSQQSRAYARNYRAQRKR